MGRLPTGSVADPDVSGSAISGVVLRRAVPEDRAQLIQGSRELLGREVSEEAWDWWFQRSPAGPAIQFVLDQSGRVVGHLARVRGDVWVARERLKIGLGSYTWVAPGHQGQSGFRRLLSACLAEEPGVDLQVGFSDQRLARLYDHVGAGRHIGALRWWSGGEDVFDGRVGPHYALLRLAARMATWIFSAGPPLARVRPLALEECADELDVLAADAASFATCIRVRDSAYLRWRWFSGPPDGPERRMAGVRDRGGVLRGWVIFGSDPNSQRGLILDLLARDARTTRALLLHAARELRADGHTGVWFLFHDPRPWTRRALARAGFLPRGSDKAIIAKALSDRADPAVEQLQHWYLTYGDTDWFHARPTTAPG